VAVDGSLSRRSTAGIRDGERHRGSGVLDESPGPPPLRLPILEEDRHVLGRHLLQVRPQPVLLITRAVDSGEAQHGRGKLRLAQQDLLDEDLVVVVRVRERELLASVRETGLAKRRALGERYRVGRRRALARRPSWLR